MQLFGEKAREQRETAEETLRRRFSSVGITGAVSAQYVTGESDAPVIGITGLGFSSPLSAVLLDSEKMKDTFAKVLGNGESLCILTENGISAFTERADRLRNICFRRKKKA